MTAQNLEFEAVEKDVVFGTGGGHDLLCDVYTPADTSKRTAIIHLHGGAFRGGSKDLMAGKVQAYVRRGYVCIAAQYRLTGEAKWPAQIEDVKGCIRWVRANAGSLGIDQDRIVVAGYSAGGLLALMAAGTMGKAGLEGSGGNEGISSDIAACLAYYARDEIHPADDGTPHLLMTEDSSQADYRAASPLHAISDGSPPTVFFHGTEDITILPESSDRLYAALIAAGVPAELHTFHGVPHEFDRHPEFSEQCAAVADLFLDRLVINPRKYPPFAPSPQPATA